MGLRRTVAHILSTNHAGSHYLSLVLGSHTRAVHLGEASRVARARAAKPVCERCADTAVCPVFRGVAAADAGEIYEVVFSNVGPGVQLLVDNSKKPRWAEAFLRDRRITQKYVHLVRDPRALMRRWSLHHRQRKRGLRLRYRLLRRRPDLALPGAAALVPRFYLYKWLAENQAITRFLARHRLDAHVITYRDLADAKSPALEQLVEWLGLPYEEAQREYWNFTHHGSEKRGYDWVKRDRVAFVDTRWRDELSERDQAWATAHRRVRRYLRRCGLRFVEDGLSAT